MEWRQLSRQEMEPQRMGWRKRQRFTLVYTSRMMENTKRLVWETLLPESDQTDLRTPWGTPSHERIWSRKPPHDLWIRGEWWRLGQEHGHNADGDGGTLKIEPHPVVERPKIIFKNFERQGFGPKGDDSKRNNYWEASSHPCTVYNAKGGVFGPKIIKLVSPNSPARNKTTKNDFLALK